MNINDNQRWWKDDVCNLEGKSVAFDDRTDIGITNMMIKKITIITKDVGNSINDNINAKKITISETVVMIMIMITPMLVNDNDNSVTNNDNGSINNSNKANKGNDNVYDNANNNN